MSKKEHRLGVSEINLVHRQVKLVSADQNNIDEAIKEIDELLGLDAISIDKRTKVLNLAYDASRLSLDGIEAILAQHDVEISHDWWTHLKEGYYRFVDKNVKDNAAHQPWSCHKPPPGSGRKPR